MIVTAVVCPAPPLLLRELSGTQDVAGDLRATCRMALETAIAATPDVVVVVGGDAATGSWDPDLPLGVRRFGTTAAPDDEALPLSLAVGQRLLDETGYTGLRRLHTVAWHADSREAAAVADAAAAAGERVVLLVMADGSARRGEKSPGHLDERAFDFDDEIGRSLAAGDAAGLLKLDPILAGELLVQGRAALAVLGAAAQAAGVAVRAEVLYRDDPFGVMYTVALWHLS